MRILTTVSAMQRAARRWHQSGVKIGFVPTMGCLHAGHLSLVKQARKRVGNGGKVVVSIYVNPTQFGPNEDFSKYPRDLAADTALTRSAGVDCLFVPRDDEIYPKNGEGAFSTYVVEESLGIGMEGATRPDHFRGVATIVAKLFNIVMPSVAVFGQKDFQQASVVRRIVRDLNFPIRVVVAPTGREEDGLALSSRNRYLSAMERQQAVALFRTIQLSREIVRTSAKAISAERLRRRLITALSKYPAVRLDYIAFFDPNSLRPMARVEPGIHMALAAYVGTTRLIDNGRL